VFHQFREQIMIVKRGLGRVGDRLDIAGSVLNVAG
jgi:hypothetical protein